MVFSLQNKIIMEEREQVQPLGLNFSMDAIIQLLNQQLGGDGLSQLSQQLGADNRQQT
jgi:hypothetical protein